MRIVETAVKRPVAMAMFTLAILLFGMVSLNRLSVNLLPDLSYPTLTIRTGYSGAAPAEVEQLVTKPTEDAIGVVKGIKSITSTSRAGQSDVVVEFVWGTDMDFASLEVREKLDILQLPLDVEKPRLLRFNPSLDPVIKMGLGFAQSVDEPAPQVSVEEMKQLRVYADEQIKRSLEALEGVASVRTGGGLENEIQVLVDQAKSTQLKISMASIIDRLKRENVNTAGGRIDQGSQAYLVRTLNQFVNLEEIENVYVGTFEGRNIRIKDIATVTNTYKERDAITRFDGVEGTEIAIYKEGDANAVDVASRVKQQLSKLNEDLPQKYQLRMVYDQSLFIDQAINEVTSAAIFGGLLAMLVLYLFLRDFWSTLVISVSIPVCIIATFNLMYGNDISLNIMSLGGIALAVGLLVDNSIVVLENIDRHRRRQAPTERRQATINGTSEVSGAIVASTLTTLAVFVPLIFVQGIAGQLFRDQAMTVSFALLASLVVAITLIPSLVSRKGDTPDAPGQAFPTFEKSTPPSRVSTVFYWITWPVRIVLRLVFVYLPAALMTLLLGLWYGIGKVAHWIFAPLTSGFARLFEALESGYRKVLNTALAHRVVVLMLLTGATLLSLFLVPRLGMELIPKMTQGEFYIDISLPSGTQIHRTDELLAQLSREASRHESVARTYSLAGTGSLVSAAPHQGGDHWGRLNVVMQADSGSAAMTEVTTLLREFLQSQAGVQSRFGEPELFTFDAPVQVKLKGYDLDQLQTYSQAIITAMEARSRFTDLTSTLRMGNPELKIAFNHAKLARLNLNAATVAELVSAKIGGQVASQYSLEERKVDILVRTQLHQRDNVNDVRSIIVNPDSAQPVPLGAVADVYMSTGPSEITRLEQQRVVLIEANLAYGDLADGVEEAQQVLNSIILPTSLTAAISGQSDDMQTSFTSLQFALALAVFLVYLVMACQFESLLHPLLILFAVPLAGAGSIYGLWLTGTPLSVIVFIGLIMLSGIVVNNAIVLVDRINQLRQQGMAKQDAIIAGGVNRLRPILMTTLTTVLGLLPMAIGVGEGAEVRTPMAITVIFGLAFATVLTLILLPVLYALFDSKRFATAEDAATVKEQVYG